MQLFPSKKWGPGENPLDFFFLCQSSASGNCHSYKIDIPEPALHELSFPRTFPPYLLLPECSWCIFGAQTSEVWLTESIPKISGKEK